MPQKPPQLTLRASGPLACFTRPEFGVERVSYPWITPSAARAIFAAILWKPRIRYEIREIQVLTKISFKNIRRNEIGRVIATSGLDFNTRINTSEIRQQRNTNALANVDYLITAELFLNEEVPALDGNDNHGKYRDMFTRRLERGQCFHQPYLGVREFAAHVQPPQGDEEPIPDSLDHGLMFYDFIYPDKKGSHKEWVKGKKPQPVFYKANMEKGIIAVPPRREVIDQMGGQP